jgi:hypothetical protein
LDDVLTRLDLTAGAETTTFDVTWEAGQSRRLQDRRNWSAEEVSSYFLEPSGSVLVQEARD